MIIICDHCDQRVDPIDHVSIKTRDYHTECVKMVVGLAPAIPDWLRSAMARPDFNWRVGALNYVTIPPGG